MVASSAFRFVITGRGGHAAIPHANTDPNVALAHAVVALQSLVSREISPRASAVVSVAAIASGDVGIFNVVPGEATAAGCFYALVRSGGHASNSEPATCIFFL